MSGSHKQQLDVATVGEAGVHSFYFYFDGFAGVGQIVADRDLIFIVTAQMIVGFDLKLRDDEAVVDHFHLAAFFIFAEIIVEGVVYAQDIILVDDGCVELTLIVSGVGLFVLVAAGRQISLVAPEAVQDMYRLVELFGHRCVVRIELNIVLIVGHRRCVDLFNRVDLELSSADLLLRTLSLRP